MVLLIIVSELNMTSNGGESTVCTGGGGAGDWWGGGQARMKIDEGGHRKGGWMAR